LRQKESSSNKSHVVKLILQVSQLMENCKDLNCKESKGYMGES
jgi:hypothetical protein